MAVGVGVLFGALGAYAYLSSSYQFVPKDEYKQLLRGALPVADTAVVPVAHGPAPQNNSSPQNNASPPPNNDAGRERDRGRGSEDGGGPDRPPPATGEYIGEVEQFDLAGSAAKGAEGAKITLVEFSDFECPACEHWAPEVVDLFKERSAKLRLVFKHAVLPDHKDARNAAHASEAAKLQGKFWEYSEVLFKNNKALATTDLIRYAKQVGLDLEKFKRDMESPEVRDIVNRDVKEGERSIARSKRAGVPAFFINGRRADVNSPQQLAILLDDVK